MARSYGEAFGSDVWAINLFAEEVIRGGPAFAVSLVLSRWAGRGMYLLHILKHT